MNFHGSYGKRKGKIGNIFSPTSPLTIKGFSGADPLLDEERGKKTLMTYFPCSPNDHLGISFLFQKSPHDFLQQTFRFQVPR